MGANPNLRGTTELVSPLYRCLSLIGLARQGLPQSALEGMPSPSQRDVLRRHGGILGDTLAREGIDISKMPERHRAIWNACCNFFKVYQVA